MDRLPLMFLMLLAATIAVGATRTSTCEKTQFDTHIFPHLVKIEPQLKEHLLVIRNSSKQSGAQMALTNCQVTYPVNAEGKIENGQWSALVDHVWETRSPEGKLRRHQAGFRVVFTEEARIKQDPVTCENTRYYHYSVRGVTYCWGPDGCTAMGIPYPADRDVIGRSRWRWSAQKNTAVRNPNEGWTPVVCPAPESPSIPALPPTTIYYPAR